MHTISNSSFQVDNSSGTSAPSFVYCYLGWHTLCVWQGKWSGMGGSTQWAILSVVT